MSNKTEIIMEEETYEEMNHYQLDANEYDENDEGTVEYLDLELEVDQISESAEEYITEIQSPKANLSVMQSSVLKPNSTNSAKAKHKQLLKANRATQQNLIAPTSNVLRMRSAMENSANSHCTSQAAKEKIDYLASTNVHEAVNIINAKLANSAQNMNGQDRNNISNERVDLNASSDEAEASQIVKSDMKCEGDSLDLFFQSMAKTVLHLPAKVQAKIKMDIYKVIAMAEIKYGNSNSVQADKL